MAKTIKFNLILDGYPVRNIEGLQEHFSIEDMLKYYKNDLLVRWLEVRGYTTYLDKVSAIPSESTDKKIIAELISTFEIAISNADVEKGLAILDYLDEAKAQNEAFKNNANDKRRFIEEYHLGYDLLIADIEENKDNVAIIKADAIEIEKEYLGLFELNHFDLFNRLKDSAPKAIFVILSRDVLRKYWMSDDASTIIKKRISTLLNDVKNVLGTDLLIEKKDTQQGWDTIKAPNVEVMIISIATGAFVRNCDNRMEKLSQEDINGKFIKLQGLDYQCSSSTSELLYMEV